MAENVLQAGTVVGVNGATCVLPAVCERCGAAAEHWEGCSTQGSRSGVAARVAATCGACAAYLRERREWLDALAIAQRRDYQVLLEPGSRLEDSWTTLPRTRSGSGIERWQDARRNWERQHGAPLDPADRN